MSVKNFYRPRRRIVSTPAEYAPRQHGRSSTSVGRHLLRPVRRRPHPTEHKRAAAVLAVVKNSIAQGLSHLR